MAPFTAATDLFELMMCWVCQALEATALVEKTCQLAIWGFTSGILCIATHRALPGGALQAYPQPASSIEFFVVT